MLTTGVQRVGYAAGLVVRGYSDELRTEKLLWTLLDEPDTGSESLCIT